MMELNESSVSLVGNEDFLGISKSACGYGARV